MKILIVEDEKRLAEAIAQILSQEKHQVEIVHDGETGLEYALSGLYDAIVLDVMIPHISGFDVVRQIRQQKNMTPVLLLTAKDEISDKVKGLDCGADDYMTKPFSPEELLARLRAISRRQGDVIMEELSFYDLTLDLSNNTLTKSGKSIHLSFKEFEVLRILMANAKQITPKEDLISKVWGCDSNAEDNNVEAYISFLRKKFFYLGSQVTICTIRKVGYRLEVEVL